MPIYEYKCLECGSVSEVLLYSIDSDSEDVKCADCSSKDVERLISASYVINTSTSVSGSTCCGRTERCQTPPCSIGDNCRKE